MHEQPAPALLGRAAVQVLVVVELPGNTSAFLFCVCVTSGGDWTHWCDLLRLLRRIIRLSLALPRLRRRRAVCNATMAVASALLLLRCPPLGLGLSDGSRSLLRDGAGAVLDHNDLLRLADRVVCMLHCPSVTAVVAGLRSGHQTRG